MAAPAGIAAEPFSPGGEAKHRLAFVLEQTLGHVAHGRNLSRAAAAASQIDAVIIPIDYTKPAGVQKLPLVRTWSFRASQMARYALQSHMACAPLDAIFMHTQVTSLLSTDLMRSVPTIISLDATPRTFDREGDAYGHRRVPEVVELFKDRFSRRSFAAAARFVAWCRWAAYSLVSDYGVQAEKIDVIPPGVDLSLFRPMLTRRRTDSVRLLFVGGDFVRKGGPDLLEAARALPDSVRIDLVTGSDDVVVPAGVRATVHRGLSAQSDELVQLFRSADIFVLPSRGDCMPQAIAEALACGLPVVATAVGAIPEMVDDGVNGYLVRPRSPRALAAAISALVNSPTTRYAMGRRSLKVAELEHDAARNNGRIISTLKMLAANNRMRLRVGS